MRLFGGGLTKGAGEWELGGWVAGGDRLRLWWASRPIQLKCEMNK